MLHKETVIIHVKGIVAIINDICYASFNFPQ